MSGGSNFRRRRPEKELDYNMFDSATKAALKRREKSMGKRDSYDIDESGYEQERIQSRRALERLKRRSTHHDQFSSSRKNLMGKRRNFLSKEKSVFNHFDLCKKRHDQGGKMNQLGGADMLETGQELAMVVIP